MNNNKKAVELSINTIVIISIALITMVAVTIYFFGGFKTTGGAVEGVSSGAAGESGGTGGRISGLKDVWEKKVKYKCLLKSTVSDYKWMKMKDPDQPCQNSNYDDWRAQTISCSGTWDCGTDYACDMSSLTDCCTCTS